MTAIGRNAPCRCGSGLKYKRCCALKPAKASLGMRLAVAAIVLMLLSGAVYMLVSLDGGRGGGLAPERVWSAEHGHWH